MKIIPAIMSGGSGTRLWPLSTEAAPKQLHPLPGPRTMLQETAARFPETFGDLAFLPPLVIANARHGTEILFQLDAIGQSPAQLILEPVGRNTAATALLAALCAQALDPDALVLLLPADHVVADAPAFLAAIARAAETAKNRIVTFGIEPSGPETGYGYIERGDPLCEGVFEIARFVEKPNAAKAAALIQDGRCAWNAGIFFFSPSVVLGEFDHAPDIRDGVLAAHAAAEREGPLLRLPYAAFQAVPAEPFDKAVMEKTTRGAVAPCAIGWADVGSWSELWRIADKDAAGNAVAGAAALEAVEGSLVLAHGVPVGVAGLRDVIVVATPHGVIVVGKDHAQSVKSLANALAHAPKPASS